MAMVLMLISSVMLQNSSATNNLMLSLTITKVMAIVKVPDPSLTQPKAFAKMGQNLSDSPNSSILNNIQI